MQRRIVVIILASFSSALAAPPDDDRRAILALAGNFKVRSAILSQNGPAATILEGKPLTDPMDARSHRRCGCLTLCTLRLNSATCAVGRTKRPA